jgi:hypothetical protein
MANSITDPNTICELVDCLAMTFVDEFLNFLTFSVVLLVLGFPECSSSGHSTSLET